MDENVENQGQNAETPPEPAHPQPEQSSTGTNQAPQVPQDAKDMAMLCHLLGIVGFFAPLVIWLNEKDKHGFINEHGRAAINYQISIIIYYVASWMLCFIFIGLFMLFALVIMHIVFVIMGAVKASNGTPWKYPIAIRFLK
jgi:uncharacterized Tic20 family protein